MRRAGVSASEQHAGESASKRVNAVMPGKRSLGIKSAEQAVYEAMRGEILDGIAPGTPLRLAHFAERLGVSTMPVRSALMRLEAEGLVRHLERRGAEVAPLSVDDFEEIQALRAGIEGLAARRGAPRMSEADLRAVRKGVARLHSMAAEGKLGEYIHLNEEIHDVCYLAAERPRMMELVDEHRRPAERYVRLVVRASPNFVSSVKYVERFVGACEARDGALAEEALRDALQASVRQIAIILPAAARE
jgi:DNA-binding GntR family transcriptional regulator